MTSKISGSPMDAYAALARPAAAGARSGATTPTAAPGATDSVQLTDRALLLQDASALAHQASGIDTAKVETVSRALRDGSYRIDPQAIAAKMLQSEREIYG
ncbi:flagellar biosynthesis anti-sigma factor FlgM [Solimonas flava]|uniref:flagellar biosynthesis anti-sigma factor FlgM n=1 Tax=Solimonas flava TaxID=415849 RepID=UPI00042496A0|nr:flagellar biosynthesis anti-sigma factor FlgM [Solimonas flava]